MVMPPYFVGKLDYHCEPEDDYTMVLDAPLGFIDSAGDRVEAPAGLITDGASVGSLLNIPVIGLLTRFVMRGDQFDGPFRWPATVHDAEYAKANDDELRAAIFSGARAAADRRIREGAMTRLVVIRQVADTCQCSVCVEVHQRTPAAAWRAWTVWALLRVAGFKAWMDDSGKATKSLALIKS